jgi:uncharacterized DUF497 family protein
VDYECDPSKAKENLRKHGVDFADAVIALEDVDQGEQRFWTWVWGPF